MTAVLDQAVGNQPIDTKTVTGRRSLRFDTYDALLEDARAITQRTTRTLGNWSVGEILDHLARSLHAMIDGPGFALPMPVRFVMRLTMKRKMLSQTLDPGFKFPEAVATKFQPQPLEVSEALELLAEAVDRAKSRPDRALHPAFGRITTAEWDAFQLRHCEMHMSFIVPE